MKENCFEQVGSTFSKHHPASERSISQPQRLTRASGWTATSKSGVKNVELK
jgi:hypothetical protein